MKAPIVAPATPEKKRSAKAAAKEERKSSGKKVMNDKDFEKFCVEVQAAAIQSDKPLPLMSDKQAAGSTAGVKRTAAARSAASKASAPSAGSKRARK